MMNEASVTGTANATSSIRIQQYTVVGPANQPVWLEITDGQVRFWALPLPGLVR